MKRSDKNLRMPFDHRQHLVQHMPDECWRSGTELRDKPHHEQVITQADTR
jgi:hypothetical protein